MKYWANFPPAPIEFDEFFGNNDYIIISYLTLSERLDNPLRAGVLCPGFSAFSWYEEVSIDLDDQLSPS